MPRWKTWSGTVIALAAATVALGCSTTVQPPGGRLTASQQILATEAIDRALDGLQWPNVDGRSVFVDIGAPAAEDERRYLQTAVTSRIAERGARVASDLKSADYALVVLGKAIGIDESRTFFGIPAMQSSLVPIGVPEIPLYKSDRQKGVAKLETFLTNRKRGGVVAHSDTVNAETWVRDRTILLFNMHDANTKTLE